MSILMEVGTVVVNVENDADVNVVGGRSAKNVEKNARSARDAESVHGAREKRSAESAQGVAEKDAVSRWGSLEALRKNGDHDDAKRFAEIATSVGRKRMATPHSRSTSISPL
tara:strand:+ start:8160 stop:8495 length:336 start_codon:yes stop_codon:yes gene_type:complete